MVTVRRNGSHGWSASNLRRRTYALPHTTRVSMEGEEEAAARIQAIHRGRLARLSLDRRRRSLVLREATARWDREQAVIKIQVIKKSTTHPSHSTTYDTAVFVSARCCCSTLKYGWDCVAKDICNVRRRYVDICLVYIVVCYRGAGTSRAIGRRAGKDTAGCAGYQCWHIQTTHTFDSM